MNRTTYRTLLRTSEEFKEAFELVNRECPDERGFLSIKLLFVRSYLICHALELAFKSYLMKSGKTEKELKDDYGHNLKKLLTAAEEEGLNDISDRSIIEQLDSYYSAKELEYFKKGHKSIPDLSIVLDIVNSIHRMI